MNREIKILYESDSVRMPPPPQPSPPLLNRLLCRFIGGREAPDDNEYDLNLPSFLCPNFRYSEGNPLMAITTFYYCGFGNYFRVYVWLQRFAPTVWESQSPTAHGLFIHNKAKTRNIFTRVSRKSYKKKQHGYFS